MKGTKKYLAYAVGEIVLVVIGILIAVSINNANERSKEKRQRIELAQKVYNQMIIDSTDLNKVLVENREKVEYFNMVLRQDLPAETIGKCADCRWLITTNHTIANSDPKVKLWLDKAELGKDELSQELRRIEENYVEKLAILKLFEESIVEELKNNMQHLKDNYDWFGNFISNNVCDADCEEYFANDPGFRNRVAYMELLLMRAYQIEVGNFNRAIGEHLTILEDMLADAGK